MNSTVATKADKLALKRVRAVIRSWDGPHARLGCEIDPKEMPWGPFEALGREVTLLMATPAAGEFDPDSGELQADRALRYVEHAVARCGEFSTLQNGSDPSWRRSQETWEWIRDRLTSQWMADAAGAEPDVARKPEASPIDERLSGLSMPGAARTLEVAAVALRSMPLGAWRDAVATLDPDMPTREETIQTLKGVARLLSSPSNGHGTPKEAAPSPGVGAPAVSQEEEAEEEDFTLEYARGFDEGYQVGRRVGRALAAHERMKGVKGGGHSQP